MKNYDANRKIYTATGIIIDIATSQSSASHGGSITLYHLLIAIAGAEEPELLYFHASTYEKGHFPLPFLSANQQVKVQYREMEHNSYDCLAHERNTTLGKSLELLFLELDWNSTHYMIKARQNATESEMKKA